MCDESPFYKEITDRKNNMSDEDIEQQRRFNAQAAEARRQRRIEDNLEKKCKDLLSINLVLEAKLMVEQNKYKDLESQNNSEFDTINQLRTDIQSKEQTINNIQTSKPPRILTKQLRMLSRQCQDMQGFCK